jgi:hypothetical protein
MKEPGVSVLFVESICTDSKVIEANLVEKVRLSPVGLFWLCIRSLLAVYEVSFDTYAYLRYACRPTSAAWTSTRPLKT